MAEYDSIPVSPRVKDERGNVYGKLTVLDYVRKNGHPRWLCRCACGNLTAVRGTHLRSGSTRSCRKPGCATVPGNCFKDRTGKRYGKLLVLSLAYTKDKRAFWTCQCDCGNIVVKMGNRLHYGLRSCSLSCAKTIHGYTRNGVKRIPEYNCWLAIKDRCYNPNNIEYQWYGGRGIRVCERWRKSFLAFYEDMGTKPKGRYEIDRISNDGNYEPGNCRWVTRHQQARNRSDNHFVTFQGETLTVRDWSNRLGISFQGLSKRLKRWSLKAAMTTPLNPGTRRQYRPRGIPGPPTD